MEGSECVDGFCTNPFYNGGCLKHMIPTWHKVRVCNSRDPPLAMRKGFCRPSPLDFMEIRINSNNWESAFFSAWILTVILSEILDVPVSIETGFVDLNVDFYDAKSSFDYGVGYGWDALRTGAKVGDCRKVKHDNPDEYIPCAHFMPELWAADYADARVAENEGAIESPADLGALGAEYWYVPKFTAERDPSITSYIGLQGQENRRKLAELFKRPTTWKQVRFCGSRSNFTPFPSLSPSTIDVLVVLRRGF